MESFFEDIDQMELSDDAASSNLTSDCNLEPLEITEHSTLLQSKAPSAFVLPSRQVGTPEFANAGEIKQVCSLTASDPVMAAHMTPVLNLASPSCGELNAASSIIIENPVEKRNGFVKTELVDICGPLMKNEPILSDSSYFNPNTIKKIGSNMQNNITSRELIKAEVKNKQQEYEKV